MCFFFPTRPAPPPSLLILKKTYLSQTKKKIVKKNFGNNTAVMPRRVATKLPTKVKSKTELITHKGRNVIRKGKPKVAPRRNSGRIWEELLECMRQSQLHSKNCDPCLAKASSSSSSLVSRSKRPRNAYNRFRTLEAIKEDLLSLPEDEMMTLIRAVCAENKIK